MQEQAAIHIEVQEQLRMAGTAGSFDHTHLLVLPIPRLLGTGQC